MFLPLLIMDIYSCRGSRKNNSSFLSPSILYVDISWDKASLSKETIKLWNNLHVPDERQNCGSLGIFLFIDLRIKALLTQFAKNWMLLCILKSMVACSQNSVCYNDLYKKISRRKRNIAEKIPCELHIHL